MTEEEYRREQEEREQLINQYNSLVEKYNQLVVYAEQIEAELNTAQANTITIISNAKAMATHVLPRLDNSITMADEVQNLTYDVMKAIEDLKNRYFKIKNVSTSSKKLTELDDLYNRLYRFYNKLRKISLAYVIGVDSNIISNETLRVEVEKQQLMNSDYWLSYALSAVMLWINDEKKASTRAVEKALEMDEYKTSLYFMLINLRFGRTTAAQKWYEVFSKGVDIFNIRPEWEFILQAYLHHGFGYDKEFERRVKKQFTDLLEEMRKSFARYESKVIEKVTEYGFAFPYSTAKTYSYLQLYCKDYGLLLELLTCAEKNGELAKWYASIYEQDDTSADTLKENIENVLYDLVSEYDSKEYEIIKQIKYHEYVIKSKGDIAMANRMVNMQNAESEEKITLDELMFNFAFADPNDKVDNRLQKFALSFMIDLIKKGFAEYQIKYRDKEKEKYTFYIDGCTFTGNDLTIDESRKAIADYYKANKRKLLFADKKYTGLLWASIGFTALTILMTVIIILMKRFVTATTIIFAISVVLTILFWILWALRRQSRTKNIQKRMLESLEKLNKVNEDFIQWKKDYQNSDVEQNGLQETLNNYKWEEEHE